MDKANVFSIPFTHEKNISLQRHIASEGRAGLLPWPAFLLIPGKQDLDYSREAVLEGDSIPFCGRNSPFSPTFSNRKLFFFLKLQGLTQCHPGWSEVTQS